MPDYNQTKIYKLYNDSGDIYIGSTTLPLTRRLSKHKSDAKYSSKHTTCVSRKLFENNNNVFIELIEYFPCENKSLINIRESDLILSYANCINKNMPYRTAENKAIKLQNYGMKYYEMNKDKYRANNKLYYINNKDRIKERRKRIYL
jgi:predicted GIY-YIG superfamily endonuclease